MVSVNKPNDILNFGTGVPYERLVASSSGCLMLFAVAVSECFSTNATKASSMEEF